jgi:hypothetical protein
VLLAFLEDFNTFETKIFGWRKRDLGFVASSSSWLLNASAFFTFSLCLLAEPCRGVLLVWEVDVVGEQGS